jgi:hypothetical protein
VKNKKEFIPTKYKQSSDLNLLDNFENKTPQLGPTKEIAKINTLIKMSDKDRSSKKLDIKAI